MFVHSVYWVCLLLTVVSGAVLRMGSKIGEDHGFLVGLLYETITANVFLTLPLATIAVALCGYQIRQFVPSSVQKGIKGLLDGFRRDFSVGGEDDLTHRVTLFRHVNFSWRVCRHLKWPWHGCLVPFERSGEYRLKSSTVLVASKNNPDRAEGFAGKVFKKRQCDAINNLPGLSKDSSFPTIERYADDTNISADWIQNKIKNGFILPRSFWGIPVEKEGRIWGVLLIDSRNESLMSSKILKQKYRPYGACLGNLLI